MAMAKQLLTIAALLAAIFAAPFFLGPEPSLSPILIQWKNMSKTTTYLGHRVSYLDQSSPHNSTQDMTLVYIHGFPTSGFDIYSTYPHLSRTFSRIIAPDLLGFGLSDKPRDLKYSIVEHTNQVVELITSLELGRVHLLTHDYGDSIGQELLARVREKWLPFEIASVCMLNGGVFPAIYKPLMMQKLLRVPYLGELIAMASMEKLFEMNMNKIAYMPHSYHEIADLWTLIRLEKGHRLWPRILAYIDERLVHEHRWGDALRESPVPLHFIHGSHDPINPIQFYYHYLKVVNNPSIDVFHDLGHYPQLEDPLRVATSYLKFLERFQFILDVPHSS